MKLNNHNCCPSHCCQIHGCKYAHKDCPVQTKQIMGMTGGCEECGLSEEGYYGVEATLIQELELENLKLKQEIEKLKNQITTQTVRKNLRKFPFD